MQDTKILLQQSRERLLITYVILNPVIVQSVTISLEVERRMICPHTIRPSMGFPLFPMTRKDLCAFTSGNQSASSGKHRVLTRAVIGLGFIGYAFLIPFLGSNNSTLPEIGANKSNLVTKTSSLGMWVPVHGEEWDGDFPLGLDRPPTPTKDLENDIIVFSGDTLPWKVGRYEVNQRAYDNDDVLKVFCLQVRYHHDGKYNVMSIDGPFEIYGEFLRRFLGLFIDIGLDGHQCNGHRHWTLPLYALHSCTSFHCA